MTKPTESGGCKSRPVDFSTLVEALDYAAASRGGYNFYSARGDLLDVLPYRDLRDQVISLARRMVRAGLDVGERVALVAQTDADFVRAFFACQYAGLVCVPLPLPMAFGGRAGYVEHVRLMLAGAKAAAVFSPTPFLEMIREAAAPFDLKMIGTYEALDGIDERGADLPEVGQDDLSYLQFSSGSTRFPVGIAVTQRALFANLRGIADDALRIGHRDRYTSWLPFYHDMGLVGFLLTPVVTQGAADLIAAGEFARRPLVWPALISQNGGTISFSPSFGYELCARRAAAAATRDLDLSTWRVAGIGGDMARPSALSRFADVFRDCRFRKESFVSSYGMAEATLALSFAPLDRGIETDCVDLDVLEREGRAIPVPADSADRRTRAFALCGHVLPRHELEIRGSNGVVLPDRQVGRVMVRGPSLMRDYFGNREETARVLSPDGWLDTGDLGYLLNGALVVTGRSKDLILVNGRNIWPQDLEWAVEREVDGLRSGDVAAISIDDGEVERIILLVQCRTSDEAQRETLRQAVAGVVLATSGLNCDVVLVPDDALPFTSSGKLSRTRARQMYLASQFGNPQRDPAMSN